MYSVASPREPHSLFEAGLELDHELPEPLDTWSLEDFEDILSGSRS